MSDNDKAPILRPTQYEPEFEPRLVCEAGHTTITTEWRDLIERGDGRCDVPLWKVDPEKLAVVSPNWPKSFEEYETQGEIIRCGAEYEDVRLYIEDVGRLLHLASLALRSGGHNGSSVEGNA